MYCQGLLTLPLGVIDRLYSVIVAILGHLIYSFVIYTVSITFDRNKATHPIISEESHLIMHLVAYKKIFSKNSVV